MRAIFTAPILFFFAFSVSLGCAASHHPVEPADLGVASSSEAMLDLVGVPGPIEFEKVVAADWVVDRSGLINLDHETARSAGLEAGDESIQLYFYSLHHPRFGTFIVDSGIETAFRDPEGNDKVGVLVETAMATERLDVRTTTREWMQDNQVELAGVFLTHIHLDHIMGLPDVGAAPVYTGPGETNASAALNFFSRGTTDRLLASVGPLREWRFSADPTGRFAGVVDVFGDGSLFAIHVPGHSPGSTAFLVRTPSGAKLLVGDASHTVWGWDHDVEPGTFSLDQPTSAQSLATLRGLAGEFPALEVHLGHQSIAPIDGLSLAGVEPTR